MNRATSPRFSVGAELRVASRQHARLAPVHERLAAAEHLAIDLTGARVNVIERQRVIDEDSQLHARLPVVAGQELQKEVVFAAEVRVEGPTRVARGFGDFLDARGTQAILCNQSLGGIQQVLPRLLAAVLPRQAFAVHGAMPTHPALVLKFTAAGA